MPQGGSQIENGKVIWTWATMQHTGKYKGNVKCQ
jgi:hypothetical protein